MSPSRLNIALFGSPAIVNATGMIPLAVPPGSLLVLAVLAIRREPISRALIATTLWPDEPEAEARANLRRSIHLLRRALPELDTLWVVERGQLHWNHAEAPIDVALFLDGIDDSERARAAVEVYRGDLLAGLEHEWLAVERERIRLLYLDALHALAVEARKRHDARTAIRYAEQLLLCDDLREDAVRELMAARYEDGDRGLALATFEHFAERLRTVLDVEPMAATLALRDAIVAGFTLREAEETPFAADTFGRDVSATPFIGRSEELDMLKRAWHRAARGSGCTILLGGDSGLGKSRLAAEFSASVERQGGRVLVGLTAQPESAPYQALVAAAQRGLPALGRERIDPVWASALLAILPEIGVIYRDTAVAQPLDPERSRARLHAALGWYFDAIARNRPVLVVLEDLHWAGLDTFDALEALARRAAGAPLLILGTFRADDLAASSGLHAFARRLRSEGRGTRTMLAPLRPDEIGQIVQRVPAYAAAPAALPAAVITLSEGNPLFAWQLLHEYEETNRIPSTAGAAVTLRQAIMSRVDRLAPLSRSVADVAATVGRTFTIEGVAVAGGWSEATVAEGLEELLARHLVYASTAQGETYAFAHALIETAVYAATPAQLRSQRHRRIARRLEQDARPQRDILGELAHHWDRAGDREPAHRAYLRAAQAALDVFAREEAALYARRAAELAPDDAGAYRALMLAVNAVERGADAASRKADLDRLDCIVARLGDTERFRAMAAWNAYFTHIGDTQHQRRTAESMLALAHTAGNPRWLISALDAHAYLHMVGSGIRDAEPLFVKAIALADTLGDSALHDRLSLRLANVQIRLGKADAALELLRLRRAALIETGTPVEWLDLLNAELNCFFILEEVDIGARAAQEQLVLARRVGDVESEHRAHSALSYVANVRGDATAMREHSDLALAAFAAAGHGRLLAVALCNRGAAEFELGRIADALAFWSRAGACAATVGASDVAANALIARAEAKLISAEYDDARTLAVNAFDVVHASGDERLVAEALVVLGSARCANGELEPGLHELREGVERHRASSGKRAVAHGLTYLLEALLSAALLPAAADVAAELAVSDIGTAPFPPRVHLALGHFHAANGDAPAAARHFALGRTLLRARLAALQPGDAKAYAALSFSRSLLGTGRRRALSASAKI